MEKIIVLGGGGHARSLIASIKKLADHELLGYVDDSDTGVILGVNYLGNDADLNRIAPDPSSVGVVMGVGMVKLSAVRREIFERIKSSGFRFSTIIASSAVISEDVEIGEGSVVLEGAVIQTGSRIGRGVIVNTRACIDHDCHIGDFVHIASGATLCGGVTVGADSLLSAGCTVIQYKAIGDHCLIGAGATVTNDCVEAGTYLGTPARKVNDHV